MAFSGPVQVFVRVVNAAATRLARAPKVGPVVSRYITEISYVGRKSGQTFTLPVGYRLTGDTATIHVAMPDQKTWWRNFLGAGAPLTIRLGGRDRSAHAVASRDAKGRVSVVATLDAS